MGQAHQNIDMQMYSMIKKLEEKLCKFSNQIKQMFSDRNLP